MELKSQQNDKKTREQSEALLEQHTGDVSNLLTVDFVLLCARKNENLSKL